ncbi:MAG: class I SAM-dependent methyltransferase [Promethearchaeota archaeon]
MDGMDWSARWKEAYRSSSLGKVKAGRNLVDFWNERAGWFNRVTRGDLVESKLLFDKFAIGRDVTVIDIGAGTGRFTIPLAKNVKSVTAIEPSPGMKKYLMENIESEHLSNVTVIEKKWEDIKLHVDLEPHDVVIAPYSLAVEDMGRALAKIHEATLKHACVFTWIQRTFWDYDMLWPLVKGESFEPAPDYIYIVNILHDMGIYADVQLFFREKEKIFKDMEEILSDLKDCLYIDDDSKDNLLNEYIQKETREEDGKIIHSGISKRVMISWSKSHVSI